MEKTLRSQSYSRLTKWLKTKREEKNFTIRELAEKLNVQHSFVGKVEQGERRLDVVEYVAYCDALEVDPHEGINIIP